ncbi:MAG: hypothetical protein D3923_00045 [Candidatus Electrothrix sp. AR3]|nr:hypothetical protein [Candidatus Electrothrix sp. AR3]
MINCGEIPISLLLDKLNISFNANSLRDFMQLEEYLKSNGSEYFSIYENVKQAAQKIWQEPRLGWYTDHGVGHSERIVAILDQLCSNLLMDKTAMKDGLRPEEVFLLLSAAYLHDIGMQDLSDLHNRSVDQQTESDWDEVRKRHPDRSQNIIAASASGSDQANPFLVGLDTDISIHIPLSLICKGHGSDYYKDVVKQLDRRRFNIDGKTKAIRGALLTSLLLLADELDLHHSRAVFKAHYPLSKVSKLHYFRHHFVQDVLIKSITKAKKQIEITLAIPESEKDKGWVDDLQSWLKQKLKYELGRTFQSIETGFDGSLYWADEPVIFRIEEALPNEKKLPSSDVKKILRLQNEHVIDWTTITTTIRNKFTSRTGGTIILNGSKGLGTDRFFTFLSALLNGVKDGQNPVQLIESINFDKLNIDGSLESIITELDARIKKKIKQRGGNASDCGSAETPEAILKNLVTALKDNNLFYLVTLQNYDNTCPQEWQEL